MGARSGQVNKQTNAVSADIMSLNMYVTKDYVSTDTGYVPRLMFEERYLRSVPAL